MSPLKKLLLPVALTVIAAALLVPATGSAQRPGRDCDRNPNDRLCQQIKKRQEIQDRQKGITPACRAAANKYSTDVQKRNLADNAAKSWKSALKKAKSDKAKAKAKKELKKAKKRLKKYTKTSAKLKKLMDTACADARIKPFSS